MWTYLGRILQGQHQQQSEKHQDRQGSQPNVLSRYIMTSQLRTIFLRLFFCNFVNS